MNRRCFVYARETSEKLDENAQIPLAQSNRIRLINKRDAQGDQTDKSSMTAGEFVKSNASNESLPEVEIRIKISCDVASQLMCHRNSAAHNTSFKIKKNEKKKILQLFTEWKDWAKYDAEYISEDKREISAEIGRLAEEAISTRGAGSVSVQSGFLSPSNGNCVRLVEREIDTVYLNGRGKYEPAEVKCAGQLTMSKVMLFNTRLFSLVAKAIASRNGATFMVVRDDREMNLEAKTDSEKMPILEIMYWENAARLISQSDFDKLRIFHGSLCCTLEEDYNNVNDNQIIIENGAENIKFCGEKVKRMPLPCEANIPKFSNDLKNGKKTKQIVIVGPNIPYFEFRLSDLYMIYKHKHKKFWFMPNHLTKVVVIANTMEDLKNIFQTYERHQNQQELNITFLTQEIFDDGNGLVVDKFSKDNRTPVQFTSFDDLGVFLYNNKLTYWKKPIPACLLLLGKGQHIPIKMITSRLSFGGIYEGTTGINLSECVKPDLIAIIGTKEECKIGNELIKKEFPNLTIHNFCLANNIGMNVGENTINSNLYELVKEDGFTFITCLPQNLDAAMKEFKFPMYKSFSFRESYDQWVAE